MKKLFMTGLLFVLCTETALASRLVVDTAEIPYTVPQGYFLATQEPYASMRNMAAKSLGEALFLHKLYISEAAHQDFMAQRTPHLNNYLMLSSLQGTRNRVLSISEFAEAKEKFRETQRLMNSAVKNKGNGNVQSLGHAEMNFADIKDLGCFDESNTSLSCMTQATQTTRENSREYVDSQIIFSSYLLTEGKIIALLQYQQLDPAKDAAPQIEAFKNQARTVLKQCKIKEGSPKSSPLENMLWTGLASVLAGAAVAGSIQWGKKKWRSRSTPRA